MTTLSLLYALWLLYVLVMGLYRAKQWVTVVVASIAMTGAAQAQTLTLQPKQTVLLGSPALMTQGTSLKATAPGEVVCTGTQPCTLTLINTATCTPRLMGGTGQGGAFGVGPAGVWHAFWCPSVSGPRLRVMAGTWAGTLTAAECINKSQDSLSKAIRACSPDDITSAELMPVWSAVGHLKTIQASRP